MRDCGSRTSFKAGLALEQEVSLGLTELGIAHRRTKTYGKEDVRDRLDMIVTPGGGRPDIEIQLTLRPKRFPKVFAFAHRALTTTTRGIRLYIEVVASHRRADLAAVGRRVARAIKLIVRRFRDFGPYSLLGIRIHAVNAKIEKFDPVAFCGRRLLVLVNAWRAQQRRLAQERKTAAEAVWREHLQRSKIEPFWTTVLGGAMKVNKWSSSRTPPTPDINIRPFFLPRRLC